MLSCERCGSSYDEMAVASIASRPRCEGRGRTGAEPDPPRFASHGIEAEPLVEADHRVRSRRCPPQGAFNPPLEG
jgi:hypothetical protein